MRDARAGVKFAAHAQTQRGARALEYIESFVAADVPPAAILRAMTTDAARLLALSGERGALKVGMAADIVAAPANPLEDIRALQRIGFLMKNGVIRVAPGS